MKNNSGIIIVTTVLLLAFVTVSWMTFKTDPVIQTEYDQNSVVVLELFTSQGCSSCPPADQLLSKVQNTASSKVIAISYHVDYWNYIGWKDPFSDPAYTERQTNYNRKFNSRSNYTPQLVVNGLEHFVGSNAGKLNKSIVKYGAVKSKNKVELSLKNKTSSKVEVKYSISDSLKDKQLRAILLIKQRITSVNRGENRNRKLTNSHIAVSENLQNLRAAEGSLSLSIPEIVKPDDELEVVLLVENEQMDISGASKLTL